MKDYEQYNRASVLMNDIEELRGKCLDKLRPSHGNVLVKILNERLYSGWKHLTLNIIRVV